MSAGEGPICLRFSSVFDCASHALETISGLVLSLSVSLCQSAETGLGFILCFFFSYAHQRAIPMHLDA